jgi:hypothetical protein
MRSIDVLLFVLLICARFHLQKHVLNFSEISSIKEDVCVCGMCFEGTRFCFLAGE